VKLPDLQSIRWKIALPQFALILAVLAGLLAFLSGLLRDTYVDTLKSRLRAECSLLSASVDSLRRGGASPAQINDFTHAAADRLGLRFTVIDADGTVLGDSEADPAAMENHLTRPEVQQALAQGAGSSIRRSATTGIETLYVAVPVPDGQTAVGIVRLAVPLSDVNAAVWRLQQTVIALMAGAAALSLLLSFLAVRRTTRPLEELTEAARAVASGNLQTTILPESRDEIGRLTEAFRIMTERLRSQVESLQTERGTLTAVLAQITDGLAILDSQGGITLFNPAAGRILGIPPARAEGHPAVEVFRQAQLLELWRKCRQDGQTETIAVEWEPRGIFLQAVATPLEGTLRGSILLLFQDLTRMRRLETVRRDFIANISHELRTPLASLQSLAETLHDTAMEDRDAANRFLNLMQTEIDSMNQAVRELLELSRIESGDSPLERQPVDPADLWDTAVQRLRALAERNGIALENRTPAGLPAVLADSARVEQVMINLIHNAVKFTPAEGSVVVSASPQADAVRFSICDTGAGISEENLSRIFERFYKADRARAGEGAGLGLSIARHIIEAHGGRIWAESAPGQGSTFYFTLPIAPPA
jgi:two-component system phosphate regulon sensor histidine kinase PhoR